MRAGELPQVGQITIKYKKIDNSGTTVKTKKTLYGKNLYNLNSLPNQTKINLLILRLVRLE